MEDQTKNIMIGVLLVITVVSLFFAATNNLTGKAVIGGAVDGVLAVRPPTDQDVSVYVDGQYAFTVANSRRPYYTLKVGTYTVTTKTAGRNDYTETVAIEAGEETVVYPWME